MRIHNINITHTSIHTHEHTIFYFLHLKTENLNEWDFFKGKFM